MGWGVLALLYALQAAAGQASEASVALQLDMQGSIHAGAQALRSGFPFPVMAAWIEQDTIHASSPPGHVRASIWIHEGEAAAQAVAYRRVLEAAGYRVAPGTLAGNAEAALTGTGVVAGRPYRFTVDFSRGPGGDRTVVLVFVPCGLAC